MDSVDYYDFSNNMAKLNRSITSFVNEGLKQYNLTRSEVPYLMTLYKYESVTQEFLSRYYDLNEGTITRALVRLEKKGFIKRVSNPNDKRKRMVSLTDEGLELALILIDYQKSIKEQVYYNFTDEEYEQLAKLLNKLFENMSTILK
ncbi:MAG: MarR family transcriptional regulator [Methanobacteriaceae archaeon]|nr:MarR family transcriptional regulator [Methanobacteriaceae archaeon]